MGDLSTIGRWLLIIGIGIAVIGGSLWLIGRFLGATGAGQLPGTIRIEGSGLTCVIPLLASLILSLLLTVVLNLVIRFLNR